MTAQTSGITEKTCQAWFLLEAADLRGLPAPRSVAVLDYSTTTLMLDDVGQLDAWAESIGSDVEVTVDAAGNHHHTTRGELHDFPVLLFVVVRPEAATS